MEAPALHLDRVVGRVPHDDVSLLAVARGEEFSVGRELDGSECSPVLLNDAGLAEVVPVQGIDVDLGVL